MTDNAAVAGSAHELPPGRLHGFEDDQPSVNLGDLLPRRTPATAAAAAVKAAPSKSLRGSAAPQKRAKTSSQNTGPTAERKNRIRSSSVHIPATLIPKIIAERSNTGRSNGEIVIVALEQTYPKLGELVGERGETGGGLFELRSSRGARVANGPLTPLNIRLREEDFDVIDRLVAETSAYSRGHLISTALTAYLGD